MSNLKYKLEALLFSSARSMTIEELSNLTKASPEEIREKISKAHIGKKISQKTKKRMSNAQKRLFRENKNIGSRKYSLNIDYFNRPFNPAKIYWMGFLVADGGVYKNILSLSSKDKKHLKKFKTALNYTGPLYPHHKNWRLMIGSKVLVNSLIKFGLVPRKSFKTYVPKQIPEKLLRHFYRGLVDGDGCICKGQIYLCGTKQIVSEFKNWANKQIKNQKGGVYRHKNIWRVLWCGRISTLEVARLLYKNIPSEIRLERKYQKYLSIQSQFTP